MLPTELLSALSYFCLWSSHWECLCCRPRFCHQPSSLECTSFYGYRFASTNTSWNSNSDRLPVWITVPSLTSYIYKPLSTATFRKVEVQLLPSKFSNESFLFTRLVPSLFWIFHFVRFQLLQWRDKTSGTSVITQKKFICNIDSMKETDKQKHWDTEVSDCSNNRHFMDRHRTVPSPTDGLHVQQSPWNCKDGSLRRLSGNKWFPSDPGTQSTATRESLDVCYSSDSLE